MNHSLLPHLPALCAALLAGAGGARADHARYERQESSCDRSMPCERQYVPPANACRPPPCREARVTDMRIGHTEYRTVGIWHAGYWCRQVDPCGRQRNSWVPGYYDYATVSVWVPNETRNGMFVRDGWR